MRALDTSVVIPALLGWHEAHEPARRAAVPSHAPLETYSVLTRLPAPHRVSSEVAEQLLAAWFPATRIITPDEEIGTFRSPPRESRATGDPACFGIPSKVLAVKRLVRAIFPDALYLRAAVAYRTRRDGLRFVADRYHSDKEIAHGYMAVYEDHFASIRRQSQRILEIGIGGYGDPSHGGGSLKMWRDYFPNAEVVGVDLHEKNVRGERITVEQCDQGDRSQLQSLADRHGPFDVVIDDGSHVGRHIIESFDVLYPAVRDGGIYVVEDLHTSYDTAYEGGPPGTPGTGIAMIQHLLDRLHLGDDIARVDVHQGIAFVHKGQSITRAQDRSDAPTFWNGHLRGVRVLLE